ncbi:MAG: DUF4317 domain-containing protein [Acutalibacteraceae bacterium]|nr:DUF4317 domain-containing protein [Acutalibacteraceae bacterium]
MNEKEIAEIRRRFNPQKTNMTSVHGCCVNEKKEITAEFTQVLANLTQDETESMLSLLKKLLSGGIDRNLLGIEFSNEQVLGGEQHKRLLKLRDSALNDETALKELFLDIISTLRIEGPYLILAAADSYDVFTYTEDGKKSEDSTELFKYFVCGVFPMKLTKPQLSFAAFDNTFKNIVSNSVICPPELGFMFPAFDDRAANIYNTVFYTKDSGADHSEIIGKLFAAKPPMPADSQRETFNTLLTDATDGENNLEILKNIQDEIGEIIAERKERKDYEPLSFSRDDICDILRSADVTDERIEGFKESYNESFGEKTRLNPKNLVETKRFELSNADISIKINPERSELVETRVIDGVKYILIRADEEIEVNGVPININE